MAVFEFDHIFKMLHSCVVSRFASVGVTWQNDLNTDETTEEDLVCKQNIRTPVWCYCDIKSFLIQRK